MIGHVKHVSCEKGYGFITVPNQSHDIYFRIKDVVSQSAVSVGDQVEVEAFQIAPGKVRARKVTLLGKASTESIDASSPGSPKNTCRPYYGKPTHVQDQGGAIGGAVIGLAIGAVLGPVGAAIGAIVGANIGNAAKLHTQTCLKCGGTGHVTAITQSHIGYQCDKCRSFWKGRNNGKLKVAGHGHSQCDGNK